MNTVNRKTIADLLDLSLVVSALILLYEVNLCPSKFSFVLSVVSSFVHFVWNTIRSPLYNVNDDAKRHDQVPH